jgi:hypothetical protein
MSDRCSQRLLRIAWTAASAGMVEINSAHLSSLTLQTEWSKAFLCAHHDRRQELENLAYETQEC